jgi:mRNA interferase MazF
MRRGEVWWAALDPVRGGEIGKTRPAVIVSNDVANERRNRVQVVPLTSNLKQVLPWEARVEIGGRSSKALADQIRTVAKERLSTRIGALSPAEMWDLERALRIQLALR